MANTVEELIIELGKLDPKLPIYHSKDEEGNKIVPGCTPAVDDDFYDEWEEESIGEVVILWPY